MVSALHDKGYSVQLCHLADTETNETSGDVVLKDESGAVIAECKAYQHNRNYHNRGSLAEEIVAVLEGPVMASEAESKLVRQSSL